MATIKQKYCGVVCFQFRFSFLRKFRFSKCLHNAHRRRGYRGLQRQLCLRCCGLQSQTPRRQQEKGRRLPPFLKSPTICLIFQEEACSHKLKPHSSLPRLVLKFRQRKCQEWLPPAIAYFALGTACFCCDLTSPCRVQDLWAKWGLDQNSYMKRFSFDEFFSKEQKDVFIRDLFASEAVHIRLPQRARLPPFFAVTPSLHGSWPSFHP